MSNLKIKIIITNTSGETAEIEEGVNPAFLLSPGQSIESELSIDSPVIIRKAD